MNDSEETLRVALSDRYKVLREIGSGGMATVYLAHDRKHERDVALKVLKPELAAAIGTERFFREIRVAAQLTHPHILPLYDSGNADGLLYYVMPYVPGQSLRQRLTEQRQLSIEETVRIAKQVAGALDFAHRRGIVHRDIKPENILLHDGNALVTDFGIALALHAADGARLTQTGLSIGTPEYMSPEQATGDRLADARSDIFALACTVYEMLSGETPFHAPTGQAVVARLLTERAPDIRATRDTVPEHVAAAIRQGLAKVPADRFENASAFADALTATPVAAPARDRRVSKYSRTTRLVATVAAAATVAVVVWLATRPRTPASPTDGGQLSMLVSTSGAAYDPALSHDGRMLAYIGGEETRPDLYVRLVSGGEPVRITNDAAREAWPVFSPDDSRVAYTRLDSAGGSVSIWVVPALGGQARLLVAEGRMPVWSPTGDEMAFVVKKPGEPDVLVRSKLDGSDRRTILTNEAPYVDIRNPTWSPDGATIAFVRSTGGAAGELWVVAADGGRPRRLVDEAPAVTSQEPVFAPDGRSVIHASNRGGATNLWSAALEGGRLSQLTTGAGPDERPSVSAAGTIVYANSRWRTVLEVRSVAGTDSQAITTHSSYLWSPAFAPDGREVAVSRAEADGSWHVWLVPVDGGAARQLTEGRTPTVYPRFTPDGAWITYFSWTSEPNRIWRVARTGGPAVAVTPEGWDAAYGEVSPDGRSLAFVRTEDSIPRVYVMPFAGGDARRVVNNSSTLPRWSPDGQWIAFTRDRTNGGGIHLIRADGTAERQLTERGGWPVWWPDGKRISYLISSADGNQQVYTASIAGGSPVHFAKLRFTISNAPIDISRDGRWIAMSNGSPLGNEIWMLTPSK